MATGYQDEIRYYLGVSNQSKGFWRALPNKGWNHHESGCHYWMWISGGGDRL
ncbi:hypothetical protein [Okeania sp. SIO2G5]|uniref:hypothetical protein n=1 Tax=Okeania sp. SIO2G5 TaxID=2607796 RepID=UPI0013C2309C|nr:hypothetical protein [Okeania sp. SIO2G5]NEP76303.1 hypothetical protein [Okeania sp. SIO2G5]